MLVRPYRCAYLSEEDAPVFPEDPVDESLPPTPPDLIFEGR